MWQFWLCGKGMWNVHFLSGHEKVWRPRATQEGLYTTKVLRKYK